MAQVHQFGAGDKGGIVDRVSLLAMVNGLGGRVPTPVKASRVARFLHPRGTITTAEVRAVAASNATLVTDDGSGNLTLTGTGLRQARSRMSPRYCIR
jgi:hypothetical protein